MVECWGDITALNSLVIPVLSELINLTAAIPSPLSLWGHDPSWWQPLARGQGGKEGTPVQASLSGSLKHKQPCIGTACFLRVLRSK